MTTQMHCIKGWAAFAAIALPFFLCAGTVSAQCVEQSFKHDLDDPAVRLIFHGTAKVIAAATQRILLPDGKVLLASDQIVTFELNRIWKGTGNRNVTVYNTSSGSEGHPLIVGRQYLVFAFVMSPEGREAYGLSKNGPDVLIAGCNPRESSNPYGDGLTDDDPGIVSR